MGEYFHLCVGFDVRRQFFFLFFVFCFVEGVGPKSQTKVSGRPRGLGPTLFPPQLDDYSGPC